MSHKQVIRILLLALFAGAAVIGAVGCAKKSAGTSPKNAKSSDIKIGFLVKMPEEPWFQNEWKFAQQCADKNDFTLVKIGATDGEKVLSAIDNLGAQGAQGFVICTPDVKLGPAIVAKAKPYNMKVFSVDDQFVGADGEFMDVHYMGISAKEIGRMVGKSLYEEYTKRGWKPADTAACAITFDELHTVKERTDGATEALIEAGFPKNKIYRAAEKTTDVPGALDAASILLTQHPEVKHWLVYSVNDEGVLGGIRAMESRGFGVDKTIGIGIGGSTAKAEFEKTKPTGFVATVLISPYRHGYETTELMYKWIKDGAEPPKDTRTTGILINRSNFEKVMKEQGLWIEDKTAGKKSSGG